MDLPLGPCEQLSSSFRKYVLIAKGALNTSQAPQMGTVDPREQRGDRDSEK